jgi:hypothetical protein
MSSGGSGKTRKLGKIDEGMVYYMKALSFDPNAVNTREYLGDLPDAKVQLIEIQNRCGISCEAYTVLTEQIAKYEAGSLADFGGSPG